MLIQQNVLLLQARIAVGEQQDHHDLINTKPYNHDITNPPAFIQVELVRGLSKKLEQYHKITDGVAFSKLLKLK